MPTTDSEESYKKTEIPPYRKICCAKATGISDLAECLTADRGTCRYALSFGYGFFCQHPGREKFTVYITGHRQ
jgi:hypothetical protein